MGFDNTSLRSESQYRGQSALSMSQPMDYEDGGTSYH